LRDAYRFYTGRDPDEAGLKAHLQHPGGIGGAIGVIANSPEANAFREGQRMAAMHAKEMNMPPPQTGAPMQGPTQSPTQAMPPQGAAPVQSPMQQPPMQGGMRRSMADPRFQNVRRPMVDPRMVNVGTPFRYRRG
jgi:hypothetical protein